MINAEELAICRRRGHDFGQMALQPGAGWLLCTACGMWARDVVSREECEEEPPKEEINSLWLAWRRSKQTQR